MTHQFDALGTRWWITLFEEDKALDVVTDDIERFVATYEANYSRFRPDSFISILNNERELTEPSEECRALLSYGKQLYMRTGEAFNFLTGHILEARGYDADYTFTVHDTAELTPGNPITDILISPEKVSLEHGKVDLGGYGKGYLVDLIAARLREEHDLKYFLINGGGDMYATSKFDEPVPIYLEHPTKPKTAIAKAELYHRAFAGSSPHRRRWKDKKTDKVHSHIIGDTTTDAIFVTADSAADADAFATTCLLLETKAQEELAGKESLGLAFFSADQEQFMHNQRFKN